MENATEVKNQTIPSMDFESNGLMTLEDISFGEEETIDYSSSQQSKTSGSAGIETQADASPNSKNNKDVKNADVKNTEKDALENTEDSPVPLSLDDIEIKDADGESNDKDQIQEDVYLTATRALLQKKLDRYNISSDIEIGDLTEEELVEFEEELDRSILDSRYESLKQVDKNVQTILDYIEAGGDPKKITKLFEEQQTISKIDTSTEKGKIDLIKSYYTEVHGWDENKVTKKIERLQATNTLEDELSDVEESYNEYFEKRVEEEQVIQQQKQQQKLEVEIKRQQFFSKALEDLKFDKKFKRDMEFIATGKGSLNGETIDILDYKIMEYQADPKKYIKLVHFLTDSDHYDAFVKQQKVNETVDQQSKKGFSFQPKKITPDNTQVKVKDNISNSKPKFNFN